MFEYFPGNYVWNLSVVAALNSGGTIDEVDRACRPIRDAATRGEDAGTEDFLRAWSTLVDQLSTDAEAAEAAGRLRTAGQLYFRSSSYLSVAERMLSNSNPDRIPAYKRILELTDKAQRLIDPATTRVEIPYNADDAAPGAFLPAYFTKAVRADGSPAPVVIQWNGLDSTKEHQYTSGFCQELAARGISTLMVDTPGTGEALRLQGLVARPDSEVFAHACVDWLVERDDVDADRIGLVGWSLGGYYAPRAAAFEKRLALVVAWGANHDWGAVQRSRLDREGERPVPHYWEHVLWVWGYDDLGKFIEFADQINLDGVVEKIDIPFLITHGENDRQIPLHYAHRSYEQATSSPKRELRVFTADEGGSEHVSLDHLPLASSFVADWIDETFTAVKTQ